MDVLWNQYLSNKYGSPGAVIAAWSPANPEPPQELFSDPGNLASYWTQPIGTTPYTVTQQGDEFIVDVPTAGQNWEAQLAQYQDIQLYAGKQYRLSFQARSPQGGVIYISAGYHENPYTSLGMWTSVNLGSEYQEYSYVFTATEDHGPVTDPGKHARITFQAGSHAGQVYLKNISFTTYSPVGALPTEGLSGQFDFVRNSYFRRYEFTRARVNDLAEFYQKVETDYASGMINYLKNDLGMRALVSPNNNYYSLASVKAQSPGDFINDHGYWDHPGWPGGRWDRNNFTMKRYSVFDRLFRLSNTELSPSLYENPIGMFASSRVSGMPFVVSEWNQPYPNDYSYEMAIMLAAYAGFMEWDGVMVHAYSGVKNPPESTKMDYFNIELDPQKMAAVSLGSLLYWRGGISPAQQSFVLPHSQSDLDDNLVNYGTQRVYHKKYDFDWTSMLRHKFAVAFSDNAPPSIPVYDNSTIVATDTGQIWWDRTTSVMYVRTPMAQGAVGKLNLAGNIVTDNLTFTAQADGAVMLVPLDTATAIGTSRNLLLYAAGQVKNTGAYWYDDPTDSDGDGNKQEFEWGAHPPLLKSLNATARIRSTQSGLRVYALDATGMPSREITSSYAGGEYIFDYPNDTQWVILTDNNNPPRANISATVKEGKAPLTVGFTSTVFDVGGSITALTWNFGDGQTSNEPNPSHTFASPGTYQVSLTVSDDQGVTATTGITISAYPDNRAPVLDPVGNWTVTAGQSLQFMVTAQDPDNTPNLLPNGSFENGLDRWTIQAYDEGTPAVVSDVVYAGQKAAHFLSINGGAGDSCGTASVLSGDYIPVTPGATYELSGYAKANGVISNPAKAWETLYWTGRFYDAGKTMLGSPYPDVSFGPGTYEWKKFSKTYVAPPTASYYRATSVGIGGEGTGEGWVDHLMLREVKSTNQALTFAAPLLPQGATFDAATGIVSWTPQVCQTGTAAFTIRVQDPNGLYDERQGTIQVLPQNDSNGNGIDDACDPVDLTVGITATPSPVSVGANLTYSITVTNYGASTASGVILNDALTGGISLVSAASSQGSCTTGADITCSLGSLTSSATATVTIVVTATTVGTVVNTATVAGSEMDPNTSNNTASLSVTVNPSADLAVTVGDAPDPVFAGQDLTYSLTVTNAGPSPASGVTLVNFLPSVMAPVSVSSTQGTCTSGQTVSCNLGDLSAGANANVSIVARPTVAGSYADLVSVTGNQNDPNTANNSTSALTTVDPAANLFITLVDSPDPVLLGQTVTYTTTVINNGPSATDGVVATGTLPTCNIGPLAVNASQSCTATVTASSMTLPTQTMSVSGIDFDPLGTNNTASATTTVIAPDLVPTALTASKSGSRVYLSDTTKNQGNGNAGSFTVGYYLSTNTSYEPGTDLPLVTTSGGSTACTRSVTSLAPGATSSISNKLCYKPGNTVTGQRYYVLAVDDATSLVIESSETNNTRATTGTVKW